MLHVPHFFALSSIISILRALTHLSHPDTSYKSVVVEVQPPNCIPFINSHLHFPFSVECAKIGQMHYFVCGLCSKKYYTSVE